MSFPAAVREALSLPADAREELRGSPPVGAEPEGMSVGMSESEGLPVPTSGDSSPSTGSKSGSSLGPAEERHFPLMADEVSSLEVEAERVGTKQGTSRGEEGPRS